MREILFRGKKANGEWYYSMTIAPHVTENGKITYCYMGAGYASVNAETVGQYTGLTDKNGTKIFEDDIVKYGDTVHEVVFEQRNGTAYFGVAMHDTETWHFCYLTNAAGMEVIGNIHDNPELLGGDN